LTHFFNAHEKEENHGVPIRKNLQVQELTPWDSSGVALLTRRDLPTDMVRSRGRAFS